MEQQLKELAYLRQQAANLKDKVEHYQIKLQETAEYKDWENYSESLRIMLTLVTQKEDAVRIEALNLSKLTGYEKRDYGQVKIKRFVELDILDEKKAIQWAALNIPSVLKIAKRSDFDKVARLVEGIDFIKLREEYRAQIASDLSSFLEDNNDNQT